MIGIYRIRNVVYNKCYYGSSKNINKRWLKHINDLTKNKHHNVLLQRSWNKYGQDNFTFELVEECEESELLLIEQKYLDTKPAYNIGVTSSGGDNISNNPNKDEIIKNIKQAIINRYSNMSDEDKKFLFSRPKDKNPNWKGGVSVNYCQCGNKITPYNKTCSKCRPRDENNNPFYGKKHSEETKKILSEIRMGKKPSNMKKVKIDDVIYESLTEASKILNTPSPTILWRIKSNNKKYEKYMYV